MIVTSNASTLTSFRHTWLPQIEHICLYYSADETLIVVRPYEYVANGRGVKFYKHNVNLYLPFTYQTKDVRYQTYRRKIQY